MRLLLFAFYFNWQIASKALCGDLNIIGTILFSDLPSSSVTDNASKTLLD